MFSPLKYISSSFPNSSAAAQHCHVSRVSARLVCLKANLSKVAVVSFGFSTESQAEWFPTLLMLNQIRTVCGQEATPSPGSSLSLSFPFTLSLHINLHTF